MRVLSGEERRQATGATETGALLPAER
jgi:hypothetical protein